MRGEKNTAEETKAHNLALSQVSDKTKEFTQLKSLDNPINAEKQREQEGRLGPMTPLQSVRRKRRGTMGGERWARGNKPSLTDSECVSEELSPARKFKLKVQRSRCSQAVSTTKSTSAVSPQAQQQGPSCTHQQDPAAAPTHNSYSICWILADMAQRIQDYVRMGTQLRLHVVSEK